VRNAGPHREIDLPPAEPNSERANNSSEANRVHDW
jgi:hypothetical protein